MHLTQIFTLLRGGNGYVSKQRKRLRHSLYGLRLLRYVEDFLIIKIWRIPGEIPSSQSHVTNSTWHDLVALPSRALWGLRASGSLPSSLGVCLLPGLESQKTLAVFSSCPRCEICRETSHQMGLFYFLKLASCTLRELAVFLEPVDG